MNRSLAIFILFLASIASCRREQTASLEGRRISAVELRFIGNVPPVDEERLRAHMKTKAGKAFEIERLDDDLKSLYEGGWIEDMQWLAEPDGGSVRVIAKIAPRPPMGVGHELTGNTTLTDMELAHGLDFGSWIRMKGFPESMRGRIEDFYRQNGYPEATVRCEPLERKGYYRFIISEGCRNPAP